MRQKIPNPKIFTQGSLATPEHDQMLQLFKRGSPLLSKYIVPFLEGIYSPKKVQIWFNKKTGKAYRKSFVFKSGYNSKYYYVVNLGYRNQEKIDLWVVGDKESKKGFENANKGGKIEEVRVALIECPLNWGNSCDFEWSPEKAIMNNGYYIGSVDLYVKMEGEVSCDAVLNKDRVWKSYDRRYARGAWVFEFKPKIKSFSEVLRQVKVYEQYFKKAKFVVVTASEVDKWVEVFESQGIDLIKIDLPKEKKGLELYQEPNKIPQPPTPEALLRAIKQLDDGSGVDITALANHLKWDSTVFDTMLDRLKTEGVGFEPQPGRVKLL